MKFRSNIFPISLLKRTIGNDVIRKKQIEKSRKSVILNKSHVRFVSKICSFFVGNKTDNRLTDQAVKGEDKRSDSGIDMHQSQKALDANQEEFEEVISTDKLKLLLELAKKSETDSSKARGRPSKKSKFIVPVLHMYIQGSTLTEIANNVGVSTATIFNWIKPFREDLNNYVKNPITGNIEKDIFKVSKKID